LRDVPIILLGFGNVGQAFVKLLADNDGYAREGVRLGLHSVFDRRGGVAAAGHEISALIDAKRRKGSVSALDGGETIELRTAIGDADGGILVDSSITDAETGEPGFTPARVALEHGLSVVFASKGPLVARYQELSELAAEHDARLGASAAVGIPLPSLEVGTLGVRGTKLHRFRGVFNDTTNQILRDLEKGISLEESIERARIDGTIEEDPRLDLDGWDAAYKLLILARAMWEPGLGLDAVETTGVGAIGKKELDEARSRRKRIRLIATGERDPGGDIRLRTEPEALDVEDPLYALGPGEKGCVFETDVMGTITVKSSRGGPLATAACVVKDVLNICSPPHL
jgi:homoserine dehydrogenase